MKIIIASLAVLAFGAASASAESFTFNASAQTQSSVGGPVAGGKPVGASFNSGTYDTTYTSGKKVSGKSQCAGWSAPPGTMFTTQGICVAEDTGGKFSVAFSCAAMDAKNLVADCWGRLTGMSGSYANKVGTVSWRATQSADQKTGASSGAGTWN